MLAFLQSGLKSGVELLCLVVRRFLFHCVIILVAGALAEGYAQGEADIVFLYIGLVCLFPRGPLGEPFWYVPVLLGLVQIPVLLLLGLSPAESVLWAGVQTWLQRMMARHWRANWDWAAAPWLGLCMVGVCMDMADFFETAGRTAGMLRIFWLFLVVALFGFVGRKISQRAQTLKKQRERLNAALERIRNVFNSGEMPPDLSRQVEVLMIQAERYGQDCLPALRGSAEEREATLERIVELSRHAEAVSQQKQSGKWLSNVFKDKRWSSLNPGVGGVERLGNALRDLNSRLARLINAEPNKDEVKKAKTNKAEAQPSGEATPTFSGVGAEYERAAMELMRKKDQLPQDLGKQVEGIAFSALAIVQRMRNDSRDEAAGEKFLSRYVKATHRLVDEYLRLAQEANRAGRAGNAEVDATLARTGDLLDRLEKAFRDEYDSMLQNDVMHYTAELNTLDTLLKMQGH